MNLFQWTFGTLFALTAAATAARVALGRMRRRDGVLWTAVWGAATLLVVRPDLSSRFAGILGIGRGVDLVLYVALAAGLFVALSLYQRYRRLEATVTELVRLRAIDGARRGDPPPPAAG